MPKKTLLKLLVASITFAALMASGRDYEFDGKMSETVLRNYLSRAVTEMDLLTEVGNVNDNIRMLKATGAKFAGRTVYLWGHEDQLPSKLELARRNALKVHQADPDLILQGCVFEIVSQAVEKIPVPDWAFQGLGLPVEHRNFRYDSMLYPNGRGRDNWFKDASIPDISRAETKLWFYYTAASYIDAGCEAIHFGQAEIMGGNDPDLDHWRQVLHWVREYARQHARRHFVLCDAHVPGGGLTHEGRLLFDFHSFPLRIAEIPAHPKQAELKLGYADSIYGRSRGGVTPSGWTCEHLPYLVEFDNFGVGPHPGEAGNGTPFVWGYDEIIWFARQNRHERNDWLGYAWRWVRQHDPAGFVEMPGSRCLNAAVNGKWWYYANTASPACPDGFSQEATIRQIWAADF